MEVKFKITGMNCSACSVRIEKVVSKLENVKKVEVNLLTNSMIVKIENKKVIDEIVDQVKKAGYGAQIWRQEENVETEISSMKKRLLISIIFLIPLMYVSMGHMTGLPIPKIFHDARYFSIIQLIFTLLILIVNKPYFINGFKNLIRRAPNMDSLIAIGSSAAFVYGIYTTIQIFISISSNNIEIANNYSMNLYFESAGMIVTLITLGKYLEKRAKGKTSNAIKKLIDLSPKMATVIKNNEEMQILTSDVQVGDILVIRPGETVPVDGKIIEGETYLDQSAITGESVQVKKVVGDNVVTATINKNGNIKIIAEKVGEDTALSQIIKLVEQASSSKAPIGRLADRISGIFVPIVILIAIIAALIWLIIGKDIEFALSIGISVLVISCPCALGLATPVSIMVGTGKGAQKGILIKSAESLENAHQIDTIVFDKTGTITQGKASITDKIFNQNIEIDSNHIEKIIASIENKSEHPISRTIVESAKENGIEIEKENITEFKSISGKGITAKYEDTKYIIGNEKLLKENNIKIIDLGQSKLEENKTLIYIANSKLLAIYAINDKVKKESKQAIQELKKRKIYTIILTGDSKQAAKSIAKQVEVDEVISEVMPQEKEQKIRELQEQNKKVAMVGDGINDGPALARANVGIAIGSGTDIAIETADVVLINNKLTDVVDMIRLSNSTIKNIKMNLFWAFFYNIIGIPIAAGILYPSFGFTLNPMIAAAAMSISSICVVLNALRLRNFK